MNPLIQCTTVGASMVPLLSPMTGGHTVAFGFVGGSLRRRRPPLFSPRNAILGASTRRIGSAIGLDKPLVGTRRGQQQQQQQAAMSTSCRFSRSDSDDDNALPPKGSKKPPRQQDNEESDEDFLRRELEHLDSLEAIMMELEDGDKTEEDGEAWLDLFGNLPEDVDPEELLELEQLMQKQQQRQLEEEDNDGGLRDTTPLENALLQGVVPADAGVGSGSLPGDYSFDPLNLATKDYFRAVQRFLLQLLPGSKEPPVEDEEPRPPALILRDYREAEIRHGRLAMLAAMLWPLQEIFDRLFLPEDLFGSTTVIYGGVTLPYLSLFMTLIMLLLGYLDIYAKAVKEEEVGAAFLPGECFWDPLKMLEGAPDSMKRRMQERELFNGRAAMIAVAAYIFEEATTHKPLITIPGNELLFEPAYQIPYVQAWLDSQFAQPPPADFAEDGISTAVEFVEGLADAITPLDK